MGLAGATAVLDMDARHGGQLNEFMLTHTDTPHGIITSEQRRQPALCIFYKDN
jgi:hypothetical protein